MASPGIYALRRPATAQVAQPRAVALSGSANITRSQAALSGNLNFTGLMGILALLFVVWALDRYVVDVPFFKATGAKG